MTTSPPFPELTAPGRAAAALRRTGAIVVVALVAMAGLPLGVAVARWGASEAAMAAFAREILAASLFGWGFLAACCAVAALMAVLRPERLVSRLVEAAISALQRRPWLLHVAVWPPLLALATFGGSIDFWRVVLVFAVAFAVVLHAAALRSLAEGFGLPAATGAFVYGVLLGWVFG